jgi:N-acetylglucosamine-6-phosphate deacetylase
MTGEPTVLYISNATVYTPDTVIDRGAVLVDRGLIVAAGLASDVPFRAGADEIDATGLILAPGFIDLQVNGAFGDDVTEDPAVIWRVAGKLPRYGVTSFLPTIITSPPDRIAAGRAIVTEAAPRTTPRTCACPTSPPWPSGRLRRVSAS